MFARRDTEGKCGAIVYFGGVIAFSRRDDIVFARRQSNFNLIDGDFNRDDNVLLNVFDFVDAVDRSDFVFSIFHRDNVIMRFRGDTESKGAVIIHCIWVISFFRSDGVMIPFFESHFHGVDVDLNGHRCIPRNARYRVGSVKTF